jgi:hypothetical protein
MPGRQDPDGVPRRARGEERCCEEARGSNPGVRPGSAAGAEKDVLDRQILPGETIDARRGSSRSRSRLSGGPCPRFATQRPQGWEGPQFGVVAPMAGPTSSPDDPSCNRIHQRIPSCPSTSTGALVAARSTSTVRSRTPTTLPRPARGARGSRGGCSPPRRSAPPPVCRWGRARPTGPESTGPGQGSPRSPEHRPDPDCPRVHMCTDHRPAVPPLAPWSAP